MKILVTSPNGRIGRRIVPELLAPEFSVRVIAREPERLAKEVREQIEIIRGSMDDAATLRHALDGVESVFWCVPTESFRERNIELHYERFSCVQNDQHLSNKAPTTSSGIRTFVADDSPLMLEKLVSILQRDGRVAVVGTATDGWQVLPEALKLAPDLILLELHLPHMDGAEVTQYLKVLPNAPRVFIVTADNTPVARRRGMISGADAFLTKSADIEAQLKSKLDQWFGPNSGPTTDPTG
jgi:CheY-like chemotaxis protein